jgi:RNA polymerase sigma-70 factor (ECF subfamily)
MEAATTDSELLGAWERGNQRAGAEFFERHYPSIARFFGNKAPDAAEDLVQKTFLACLEGIARFRGQSSVRTYLFGIAHNQLRLHYRQAGRQGKQQAGAGDWDGAPVDDIDFSQVSVHQLRPGMSTMLARRREERLLLEALRRIPLECQVVLELHYWEDLKVADIAAIMGGVPAGTVKTRMRRARVLLTKAMTELADSGDLLRSTLSNLDDWAGGLRDSMVGPGNETAPA